MQAEGAQMSKFKPDHPSLNRRTFLRSIGTATAVAATTSLVRPSFAQEGSDPPPQGRAMRSPQNDQLHAAGSLPALPSLGVIALNRIAFGPRASDLGDFNALGGSDEARLTAYVDQQLNPAAIDDSAFETKLNSLGFISLNKSLAQLWQQHRVDPEPPEYMYTWRQLPLTDTMRATFNRAVHSRRQLVEVLADFWHNHFNVRGWDGDIQSVFVHYDRDVIRKNLLGNFRTMLEDVAKSTAMLYFLDNRSNTGARPNENYARELFELHTMGAENYKGEFPQEQVPVSNGWPVAYVDADVYGATTCFTGWTTVDGLFQIDPNDHFPNQKVVFGRVIPANQTAEKDGRDVLDMLAQHPGTGRYVCRKLCRRFISDNPPERIVNEAAALFTAKWQAPDQLKQVVRLILLSPEFRSTWGQKIKRPFEVAVSALRSLNTGFWFNPDPPTGPDLGGDFLYNYNRMGQELFSWATPTGYPDVKEDWTSMVPMLQRWRLCHWMVDWSDSAVYRIANAVSQTPADKRSPNELVSYWESRILRRPLSNPDRQEIIDFIAQGRNPDYDLPLNTDDATQHRLRSMVGLILNTPDFQWR